MFNGHKEIVALLIANKADVNAKTDDGTTPLGAALQQLQIIEAFPNDQPEIIEKLDKVKATRTINEVIALLRAHGAKE